MKKLRFGRFELFVGILLALSHVRLYLDDFSPGREWQGFRVYRADMPVSIPLLKLCRVWDTPRPFLIGGTFWWFFLGLLIAILLRASIGSLVRWRYGWRGEASHDISELRKG
jgi:hypothetical protein